MADTYFFNGRTYSTPSVMSQIDDSAELPALPTIGNTVAFIGQCIGGSPATPIAFGDPNTPANVLISGDLLTAVQKAFAVSDGGVIQAPSKIIAVPVIAAAATAATLTINGVTLYSSIFGNATNQMLIEVVPGSVQGFAAGVQFNGETIYQDNIADNPFIIQNAGTVSFTFGAVAHQATAISCTVGANAPVSVPLKDVNGNYLTLTNFIAGFNSLFNSAGVSATVGSVAGTLAGNTTIDQVLDVTTSTHVIAAGGSLNYLTVMHALTNFFLSTPFFTATPAGQTFTPYTINNASAVAPAAFDFGYTLLGYVSTGSSQWSSVAGTNGSITNSDWAAAFTALQNQDVQWVVPLSVSASVWAMGDAHVQLMSQLGKERRQIVGAAVGTTIAQIEAEAFNLNSNRTAVAFPGYYDFNAAGILTLYPAYFTAAIAAAGFGGMSPGMPLTNKTFTVQGWELNLRNPLDTDSLIQAGVMPFITETSGYVCARSVSTWQSNEAYDKVELSVGFAGDEAARVIRAAVQPFIGGQNSPLALGRVLQAAEAALNGLAVPAPSGPGILVGDTNSPPWKNLTASLSGDAIVVNVEISPVLPTNFIPITLALVPYSGTASASAPTSASTS